VRRVQDEGAKYQLEFDTAQAGYKQALEGYDKVMIGASGQYSNVSFVSRATAPLKPSKPKTKINLLIGALLGGFLGIAIPFGRELLARRVRCRDDLERDHGIPVLVEFDPMPVLRNTP
jgi:succinoglycan biosynthesis transport protein ExoP